MATSVLVRVRVRVSSAPQPAQLLRNVTLARLWQGVLPRPVKVLVRVRVRGEGWGEGEGEG